jgi:hypothetical protein
MQSEIRLTLIYEYELAPDTMLFSQSTVAALRQCSIATVERERCRGGGVPFVKLGRLVRYRKSDIHQWLAQHPVVLSTTHAQMMNKVNIQLTYSIALSTNMKQENNV